MKRTLALLLRALSALLLIHLLILSVVRFDRAIANGTGATKMVGWAECVAIKGVNSALEAKLDTGATTASINAEIIKEPDRDAEADGIVEFYFVDGKDKQTHFAKTLTRWVTIKDKGKRPAVNLDFRIARTRVNGEATLAERSHFDYPVLVGRNLLRKGNFAVDSSRSFIADSSCRPRENS